MSTVKLIITGGTIDKVYNELDGSLIFTQTHMLTMLEQCRNKVPVESEVLMLKDSLEMNDADRAKILELCQASKESLIMISHGTDTMVETAEALQKLSGKTIVLFGAMVPYTITHSDSLFNLGCALTAVQCLSEGVYITMNGMVFPAGQVIKNKTEGVFINK